MYEYLIMQRSIFNVRIDKIITVGHKIIDERLAKGGIPDQE